MTVVRAADLPHHGRAAARMGVPATVGRLTRADVVRWHGTAFGPRAPTVVVVGDLRTVEPRVRALDLGAVEVWDADGNRVR